MSVVRVKNTFIKSKIILLIDYAYVDAERPDLPYHICRIRDLKTVSNYTISFGPGTKHSSCVILCIIVRFAV